MTLSPQTKCGILGGFVIGITCSYIFQNTKALSYKDYLINTTLYQWEQFVKERIKYDNESDSNGETLPTAIIGPIGNVIFHDSKDAHKEDESSTADFLFSKVRILCWIMTGPKTHQTKAVHVKATWGRRCNKLIFMSSELDNSLPTVKLDIEDGRNNLWGKTKQAFEHVFTNYKDEADWFLKADDDTYTVMENLRYLLDGKDSSNPVYFGHKFKTYVEQGYLSGGAGYVLSKEALKRLVESGIHDGTKCKLDNSGPEDIEIGRCMENLGVKVGDSRDSLGQNRFFPFTPDRHLIPGLYPEWYEQYTFYKEEEGFSRLSDYAISFHYIIPGNMYVFEYLIYHMRPYGIGMDRHPKDEDIQKL